MSSKKQISLFIVLILLHFHSTLSAQADLKTQLKEDSGNGASLLTPDSLNLQKANNQENKPIQNTLKLSGYIQGRFQYGEESALLNIGRSNEHPNEESFSRIGIRRGRMKLSYNKGITTGVFEIDATEKGVSIKDVYISVKDPFWETSSSVQFGTYNRPFGFETQMSSSSVESPERATVGQILFPGEKDLGGMLSLKTAENSFLHNFKLQAGLFAGNGVNQETDSKLDFIGRVGFLKKLESNIQVGVGISGYYGGVYQGTKNVYTMSGNQFTLNNDTSNFGKYAKRAYFGVDAELKFPTPFGTTMLRAEYITGSQPGSIATSESPNSGSRPTYDTYIRNFYGYYALLTQNIGKLPLIWIIKYDYYDPNTSVSADNIGLANTGPADIAQGTLGTGITWLIDQSLQMQGYYNFVSKEQTSNLSAYNENRKDNVFTLGIQYKF